MKFFLLASFFILYLTINAQTTSIPDANFEQALITLGLDSGPIDGSVLTSNISSVDSLNVALRNINFMTGIEDFSALTYLNCLNNQIFTLDVTQNLNLEYLICTLNNLSVLDVTQNTVLIDLFCSANQLTSIDVTQNIFLEKLLCGSTSITNLDVTQNTFLIHLECFNNQLNTLDVTQNTLLTYLACSNNLLTSLNVQNGNNVNFTSFGALGNPSLTCIQVDDVAWSTSNWANVDATASFSTNCSVGVFENNKNLDVAVYPNPAKGFVSVDIFDFNQFNNIRIELIDVVGGIVSQYLVVQKATKIDVSSIKNGFYTLLLKNESGIISTQKLIIRH